jgi:hypothetical protein
LEGAATSDRVQVHVNVNELRLGFSNTTRNPEGLLSITTERVDVTTTASNPCVAHAPNGGRGLSIVHR